MGKNKAAGEEYAKANGFYNCGEEDLEVEVPMTDQEKIETGKALSMALMTVRSLEDELGEIKSEFKSKIEQQHGVIGKASMALRTGRQFVKRRLSAFIDRGGVKQWIDIGTGEVMHSRPATDEERQTSLA